MSIDRQQRRARKRDLRQIGDVRMKRGLARTPDLSDLSGVALVLRETLQDSARVDRASRAAELLHTVFEASVKARPSQLTIACRKGCGYCCHTWVSATAPEIFLLARTVTRKATATGAMSVDGVLAKTMVTSGLGIAERFGRKLPCAVLIDDACGFYAERPTVCRQVIATELAGCIDEFEGRDFDGEVVASRVLFDHAGNCRLPLQAALETLALPAHSYELSAGLSIALDRGAEQRWLDGCDVFADVERAPPAIGPERTLLDRIIAEIADL
jgi:Fe-S-cluster containining protein